MPIDVEKIRKELKMDMALAIDEMLKDPWERLLEIHLLSVHDVVEHLKLLGFTQSSKYEKTEVPTPWLIIRMCSPIDVIFSISYSLSYPGVRLECEESNPDDYEEEEEDDEHYNEDEYVDEEEQKQNEKP